MARTVNPEVHTVKKEAFVEAAMRLMQARGWEQTSVQDVLDQVEASRGAFYHYFDSKQALLEAVIERLVDAGLGAAEPVVEDQGLPAIPKLTRFFGGIGRWKTERKALVLELLKVWISDDNAIVREKFRRSAAARMVPLLSRVVKQGMDEGTFTATSPEETARILVMLLLGFQEVATDMFVEAVPYQAARHAFASYNDAFERVLGAPRGSIDLADEAVLREWFG
jgi:AcrR family transcriptional regulator